MTKRTSDQFQEMSSDSDLESELENTPVTESCDVIRRKIRTLIDSGEMAVGEFKKKCNLTSPAYTRFMAQNGPDKGSGSSVYYAAWAFFKKRELKGIKLKPNKKVKANDTLTKAVDEGIENVVLEGEAEDSVEVFDTCDEIRRKINAHLKKPGVTQAAFLRAIAAQYHTEPKKLASNQLAAFRSKKGPYAGNTSAIFYGAYVYFEKLRIKDGKPKGTKRQEMEDIYAGDGGLDTKRRSYVYVCGSGERPAMDKYGQVSIFKI